MHAGFFLYRAGLLSPDEFWKKDIIVTPTLQKRKKLDRVVPVDNQTPNDKNGASVLKSIFFSKICHIQIKLSKHLLSRIMMHFTQIAYSRSTLLAWFFAFKSSKEKNYLFKNRMHTNQNIPSSLYCAKLGKHFTSITKSGSAL